MKTDELMKLVHEAMGEDESPKKETVEKKTMKPQSEKKEDKKDHKPNGQYSIKAVEMAIKKLS